ncbi:hypothetical protein R1sor_020925 [Riccia sorocarpa]|uniref:CCHC-type domain-containing protein n=1 Tax=Riccia sorocarpa TaxID=122646 RepID=A0ABD3GHQ1_9MARC
MDPHFLVANTRHLRDTSLVIYTMNLLVSHEYVERWAEQVMRQTLGVQVLGICSLSRNCFHISLESETERNHIFANTPLYMGESMVYALPWDPRFHPKELHMRSVPIWVELPEVPPNCVAYGMKMISTLGVMLYASKNLESQTSNLLKGCVLMDISKPLKEEKYFRVPGLKNKLIRQKIMYSGFPDMCFACRHRGHIAANCPTNSARQPPAQTQEGGARDQPQQTPAARREIPPRRPVPERRVKDQEGDFQTVRRRGKRVYKDPKFRTPLTVDNRFGVICPEEEEEDEELNELFEIPEEEDQVMDEGEEEIQSKQTQRVPREDTLQEEVIPVHQRDGMQGETAGDLDLQQGDRGERFTSFEEAEKQLARQASDREQQENSRLSCAGFPHPVFDEGRKKSRGDGSKLQPVSEESDEQVAEGTSASSTQGKQPLHNKPSQGAKSKEKNDRGDRDRIRVIRQWIKNSPKVAILGLQELKSSEFAAERGLQSIFPGGQTIIDYNEKGVGGAALVIKEEIQIVSRGVRGTGNVAWAKVKISGEEIGVASVYASTKSHKRIPLWHWLAELTEEGLWLVLGDFNGVELPEDSQDPANLLNGAELRHWKTWVRQAEMVDAFITAVARRGPRFTRQRIRGNQIEFSRLDRLYLSSGADWMESVEELYHDGRCGLSDHFPIILTFKIEKEEAESRPWRTYFKCRTWDLSREGIKDELREAWLNHPMSVSDPRVMWDLGWQRLKKILQQERRDQRTRFPSESKLKEELETVRSKLTAKYTEQDRRQLATLEKKVKELELKEAAAWRLRSRAKWLREGEAPSHYFFVLMKSKYKREQILYLKTEEGDVIHDPDGILQETQVFYADLFAQEAEEESIAEVCLNLIKETVKAAENMTLVQEPDEVEIEKIVALLPSEKAPGLDGVIIEVLRECWGFIKPDCLNLIAAFWADGRLTSKTKKGAIKLIPKSENREKLKDWRPISLLGITYKIISKIIAEGLKSVMPNLVNPHQTGFVQGRSIFDSILAVKLGQEWAQMSRQQAVLLKLDFAAQVEGRVQGIETSNGRHILEALFADDIGLLLRADENNWRRATEVVKQFERISGVKLNVAKSLAIPIGFTDPPRWLVESGCKIALSGEEGGRWCRFNVVRTSGSRPQNAVCWETNGGRGSRLGTPSEGNSSMERGGYSFEEELTWEPRDVLLLDNKMKLSETPTLCRMLEGWWAAKKWLEFKGTPGSLPRSPQIEQALRIGIKWRNISRKEANQVKRYLHKNGVLKLQDLSPVATLTLMTQDKSRGLCNDPLQVDKFHGPLRKAAAFLVDITQDNTQGASELTDSELWKWSKEGRNLEGWILLTKDWRWLFSTATQLHSKWKKGWEPTGTNGDGTKSGNVYGNPSSC